MANKELLNTVDQLFQESFELFQQQQRPKVFATEAKTSKFTTAKEYRFDDLVKKTLPDAIADGKEVEVRFGWVAESRFISGVSKEYFYNLLNTFKSKYTDVKPETTTTYINDKGIRVSVNAAGKKTIDKKTTETTFDDDFWGFRISIAREEKVTDSPVNFEQWPSRNKTRWSFPLKTRQMDLTVVISAGQTTYEVEMEYSTVSKKHPLDIYKDVQITLSHMQQTHIDNVIPQFNAKILLANYNILFTDEDQARRMTTFDRTENKPESFRWNNVFYGGQYYLTPKLDGIRRRIFFDANGVFEIGPGSNYIKQIGKTAGTIGTILDAELFTSGDSATTTVTNTGVGAPVGAGGQGHYYPFDILYDNNTSLLNYPFSTRLSYLTSIKYPAFQSKPFYGDKTFYEDLALAKKWSDDHPTLRFDGFIAQSNEPLYKGQKTMKIKPMEELTVDLLTRIDDMKQIRLYSRGKDGLVEENFSKPGELRSLKTDEGRYTVKNLKIPADAGNGFIAEYRFLNKEPWLRFKMIRADKIEPNFHKVVKDIYHEYFIDPTTYNDLVDGTILPWRKWASSFKRKLIEENVPINSSVLDIGIGRGGTLAALLNKAKMVFGIDPSKENLSSLLERFGDSPDALQQIQLANVGGQDTKDVLKFIGSPVDVVLSMFSLSFFFENDATLNGFCDTVSQSLKKDGKFIVMFMDGDETRKQLEKGSIKNPLMKITTTGEKPDFSKNVVGVPIKIELLTEPDPIFRVQNEWLAPFDVLVAKLKSRGIALVTDGFMNVAEKGILFNTYANLPPQNLKFAEMNRYAIFTKNAAVRAAGKIERASDFTITNVKIGQDVTIDDKWVQHGIEWDDKSFVRSFLYTVTPDSYQKDPTAAIANLARELRRACTVTAFEGLEGGRVRGRLAFDALYRDKKTNTKEKALKQARKDYLQRCEAATVGHEASGLLIKIHPKRKIIIIDQSGNEIKRYGDGAKTSYILKVEDYAYSPLSKAEGYKHEEPVAKKAASGTADVAKRFKTAVKNGDNVTVEEMILDVDDPLLLQDALKTAIEKKNYDLITILNGFVDTDKMIQVQTTKGAIIERPLKEDLIRLAGKDERILKILGPVKKVASKKPKEFVKEQEDVHSEDEFLPEEEGEDFE